MMLNLFSNLMNSIPCLILSILLSLMFLDASSQCVIDGKVVNTRNAPVAGVNIVIQNTVNTAISDYDGQFHLSSPCDSVIVVVRYAGYKGIEARVNAKESPQKVEIILAKRKGKKQSTFRHHR